MSSLQGERERLRLIQQDSDVSLGNLRQQRLAKINQSFDHLIALIEQKRESALTYANEEFDAQAFKLREVNRTATSLLEQFDRRLGVETNTCRTSCSTTRLDQQSLDADEALLAESKTLLARGCPDMTFLQSPLNQQIRLLETAIASVHSPQWELQVENIVQSNHLKFTTSSSLCSISQGGTIATATRGKRENKVCLASSFASSNPSGISRFQIRVLATTKTNILVGIARNDISLTLPEFDKLGLFFSAQSCRPESSLVKSNNFQQSLQEQTHYGCKTVARGDVIGVEVDFGTETLSFSLNGSPLGVAYTDILAHLSPDKKVSSSTTKADVASLCPCVILSTVGDKVQIES
eukprot:m.96726 g.96726  ORF g.96726 m.96726 type:complete len:351 (+) comp21997_c0_seq2:200-1252(+)